VARWGRWLVTTRRFAATLRTRRRSHPHFFPLPYRSADTTRERDRFPTAPPAPAAPSAGGDKGRSLARFYYSPRFPSSFFPFCSTKTSDGNQDGSRTFFPLPGVSRSKQPRLFSPPLPFFLPPSLFPARVAEQSGSRRRDSVARSDSPPSPCQEDEEGPRSFFFFFSLLLRLPPSHGMLMIPRPFLTARLMQE